VAWRSFRKETKKPQGSPPGKEEETRHFTAQTKCIDLTGTGR